MISKQMNFTKHRGFGHQPLLALQSGNIDNKSRIIVLKRNDEVRGKRKKDCP